MLSRSINYFKKTRPRGHGTIFQDFHKQKTSKPRRQLIFSKMAGMDQLREQVMDNHGKVYRSLMRIQDDLSIQGRGCN